MARLVIVSNRVPAKREERAGGLAVVLAEALKHETLWFGWSGRITPETAVMPSVHKRGLITYATVDLSRTDYEHYYIGFSNRSLWPLFHYRTGLSAFTRAEYQGYRRTNAKFAAMLAPLLRPDDLVWIHDYHLIPLGRELRALGCRQKLGFFLHIPFPPADLMEILPPAEELMTDFCAYDLAGFQTARDERNFRAALMGKSVRSAAIPVGIDANGFAAMARKAAEGDEAQRLTESLAGRRVLIGADRLDYSKGLPERFDAYSHLLERYPQYRRQVSFLQIAARSREDVAEYRALKRDLDRVTGKINGKYAEFDWVPLRYLTHGMARNILAGFFRMAAIGLVTPLRDGMNLVAFEYVAAQYENDPGVLILSRFAGGAASLDGAVTVNPLDPESVADAIHEGLSMPHGERLARWRRMMDVVSRDTAAAWCNRFLSDLGAGTVLRVAS